MRKESSSKNLFKYIGVESWTITCLYAKCQLSIIYKASGNF